MLGKTSATQRHAAKNKTCTPQNPPRKQNTTEISGDIETMWNMLDETDTQDASDLRAELDQLMATTLTPITNRTTPTPTHTTRIGIEETTSREVACTEFNASSDSNMTPSTTRQATARELPSCFGLQPCLPYTHAMTRLFGQSLKGQEFYMLSKYRATSAKEKVRMKDDGKIAWWNLL